MIFLFFGLHSPMATSSASTSTSTQAKQSDTILQLFLWTFWEEESCDSHSIGMIATSKEAAIRLILGRLQILKGANDAKTQVLKDLERQGVPYKEWPSLPLPSDPKMVNCVGAWTTPPSGLLSTTLRTRNSSGLLKELLSKVDPEIYPLENGLMFVNSALQG